MTTGLSTMKSFPLQLSVYMCALFLTVLKCCTKIMMWQPDPQNNNKQMSNTSQQYDQVIAGAKDIFVKKAKDYGTSWRVLRPISVADQIYIKARRIRHLQD